MNRRCEESSKLSIYLSTKQQAACVLGAILRGSSRAGEHLDASVGDQHRLFELCRALAVLGDGGPVVGPQLVAPCTYRAEA